MPFQIKNIVLGKQICTCSNVFGFFFFGNLSKAAKIFHRNHESSNYKTPKITKDINER